MSKPSHPTALKLTKPWGKHPMGTVLTVLQGVDPITPTSIDPARAATLLADKRAVEVAQAPPAAPAATAATAKPAPKPSPKKEA